MYLSVSHTWHALRTSFVPPAVYKRGAQVSVVLRTAVAVAPQIAVAVVVSPSAATSPRFDEIAETAPCNTNIVGTIHAVEVSVHAVLEVAVVHPYICRACNCEVVVAVNVVSSGTLEAEVSQNDVLARR